MDISRMKHLAGLPQADSHPEPLLEVVEIPEDVTIEQLVERLDACKRALSLVHKLPDPQDRKKWMSAAFVNLNKIRGALQRMLAKMDAANSVSGGNVSTNMDLTQQ